MALFQPSTITFANAKSRVAEAAGASGSADELTRAGYAIQQASQYWNNSNHWNYLLTQNTGLAVIGPFDVTSVVAIVGSTTLTAAGGAFDNALIYDLVSSANVIAAGSYVTVTPTQSGTTCTISRGALGSASETVTFHRQDYTLPSDVNHIYSAQMLSDERVLLPLDQRLYGRAYPSDTPSTPTHYTLFPRGERGVIRLLPTPVASDTLILKYFRRMASSYADGTALDIPLDHEFSLISLAKGLYLADKGSDPTKQQYWWNVGMDGLRRAIADDSRTPDDHEGFLPGSMTPLPISPNSVWPYMEQP